FDNYNNQHHNAHGNVLGVNFNVGGGQTGGAIYSFGTQTTIPAPAAQLIGNTGATGPVGQSGSLPASALGGLSVSPDNHHIAVAAAGSTTAPSTTPGSVYIYDYTPGDTHGAGAALANGRTTSSGILSPGNTQGTAWIDNNTVAAF